MTCQLVVVAHFLTYFELLVIMQMRLENPNLLLVDLFSHLSPTLCRDRASHLRHEALATRFSGRGDSRRLGRLHQTLRSARRARRCLGLEGWLKSRRLWRASPLAMAELRRHPGSHMTYCTRKWIRSSKHWHLPCIQNKAGLCPVLGLPYAFYAQETTWKSDNQMHHEWPGIFAKTSF